MKTFSILILLSMSALAGPKKPLPGFQNHPGCSWIWKESGKQTPENKRREKPVDGCRPATEDMFDSGEATSGWLCLCEIIKK